MKLKDIPRGAPPRKALLLLTVAVLAAHLLLLRAGPIAVQPAAPARASALLTRVVAAEPAPLPAPAPEPAAAQPVAVPTPARAASPSPLLARAPLDRPRPKAEPAGLRTASLTQPDVPQPGPAAVAIVAAAAPARTPAPQPVTFAIPAPMRLQYKVELHQRGFSLQATSELNWRHDGETYEARLSVSAPLLPTRSQRSSGRITAEGLAPERFSDKGRSEEAAHFERDKGKVSFSNNRPDVPLLAGAQDRLSVLLQLGAMIGGEPRKFPPGATITIQTAGTHDAEPWIFNVEGDDELVLPGGKLTALRLTRAPRKEFDLKVELWLAPGMDYAPVRLRLTQPNGDSVDQQWSSTDRG